MTAPSPCSACKCAIFFNRNRNPICANKDCSEGDDPGKHKLYIVVGTPGNYEWRVEAREREEHKGRLLAVE